MNRRSTWWIPILALLLMLGLVPLHAQERENEVEALRRRVAALEKRLQIAVKGPGIQPLRPVTKTSAIERRLAVLESALKVDRKGNVTLGGKGTLTVTSRGRTTVRGGAALHLEAPAGVTVRSESNVSVTAGGNLSLHGGARVVVDTNRLELLPELLRLLPNALETNLRAVGLGARGAVKSELIVAAKRPR